MLAIVRNPKLRDLSVEDLEGNTLTISAQAAYRMHGSCSLAYEGRVLISDDKHDLFVARSIDFDYPNEVSK